MAIATAIVSILSGWATAVIATDLITGWWRSDQLFCVALAFSPRFRRRPLSGADRAAAATPDGPSADRRGFDCRAVDLLSLFVAGAKLPPRLRHPGAAGGQHRAHAAARHAPLGPAVAAWNAPKSLELAHRRVVVHQLDPPGAAEVDQRHRRLADAGDLLDTAQPVLVVVDPVARFEHQQRTFSGRRPCG